AGNITVAENLWADNLVFTYKNQRIRINGEFINFPAWIAGKPVNIKINADVSADKINPVYFTSGGSIKINDKERALKMPGGIETDLVLKIDNFTHKNLKSSNINGTIKYRPGILTVENFSANTADGLISGSFFTSQTNRGSGFIFQGNFTINNININNCFSSFNNFGQNFIRAEHLSGSLSGTLKLLVQLDSLFKPDVKSLNAEGKYIIENGTLINFEPVMALSKFINIAELGNITFSKLENDLYIKNNYLAIPQMDIKSSAADFSVSGRHYFDNTYEYHVKTYLSELLSKKVKKSQIPTEFGSVEDDGLGRTYVFLKITGKGDDVKVAYDLKAAGMKIRQSLDNEKNNLKNILNEEYGLFKNDTLMKKEPAPRPKFQIEWIETDDKVIQQDIVSGKKEKIIDRIFKKKKNQNL
ncbi:MAG: hypothetical protein ACUVTX_06170, partial [Bacteroidales bacterium]